MNNLKLSNEVVRINPTTNSQIRITPVMLPRESTSLSQESTFITPESTFLTPESNFFGN